MNKLHNYFENKNSLKLAPNIRTSKIIILSTSDPLQSFMTESGLPLPLAPYLSCSSVGEYCFAILFCTLSIDHFQSKIRLCKQTHRLRSVPGMYWEKRACSSGMSLRSHHRFSHRRPGDVGHDEQESVS